MRATQAAALAGLVRHLAAAERRGLPAQEVAAILARDPQWRASTRRALKAFAESLQRSPSISAALAGWTGGLPAETAKLVHAAESSGTLAPTLDALADDFQHLAESHSAIRRAMAWPVNVAVVIVVVISQLAYFVLPAFREAYAEFGTPLPATTGQVLALSAWFIVHWWAWALPLVILLLTWHIGWLPRRWTGWAGDAASVLRFVRRHVVARHVARLVRWLRAVPLDGALQQLALAHLGATSDSPRMARQTIALQSALAGGSSLPRALEQQQGLPTHLGLYLELGDRLADRQAALERLAEMAQAEERDAMAVFERGCLLGVYFLLGSVVGAVIYAVYLPIFKLGSVI